MRHMGLTILPGLLAMAMSTAAMADASFDFRLSPGPRDVGTRADSSGNGRVHADLHGNVLTLAGDYHDLLGAPISARLLAGSAPGVRGPKVTDLTIEPATAGKINGTAKLTAMQLASFNKGGLYIEIDSAAAPEGDLWGWVLPPAE